MKTGRKLIGKPGFFLVASVLAAMALSVMAAGCGSQNTSDNVTGTGTVATQTSTRSNTATTGTSGTNASNHGATTGANTQSSSSSQPGSSAESAALPTTVGQCSVTTVASIGSRLVGAPDSGSAISYANGGAQVSYDVAASVQDWRVGDQVRLCLVSVPANCPPGDNRGKIYSATNMRTGETWQAPDSEHMCGGA